MFAFVSAFPKSLHCTDEAQQAETVLSAVLSIYIYIYIYMYKEKLYINIYIHTHTDGTRWYCYSEFHATDERSSGR